MKIRAYDPNRDRDAAHRIWTETGWLEEGKESAMDVFVEADKAFVAEMDGAAECLVVTLPGTIRHIEDDLPFCTVAAVTTSRIARKLGLAGKVTAHSIAQGVADGALVAGLGMFEQGYYNRLGFGNGSYENWTCFDPADLTVKSGFRVPRRITKDDWEAAHKARLARRRMHGACNVTPPQMTQAEMMRNAKDFGLGYYDGPAGDLSHYFWVHADSMNSGPYGIAHAVWNTKEQFLELMAVLKSLGDQVRLVKVREQWGVQLQDLLKQPFKRQQISEKTRFENKIASGTYWQLRMCDVPGCLAKTHLQCRKLRFNLAVTDPIADFLDAKAPWRGITGDYVVSLGPDCSAAPGADPKLPVLSASVNAFTRLWMGVQPASGLAITDDLSGPDELLRELDKAFMLPQPHLDWDI